MTYHANYKKAHRPGHMKLQLQLEIVVGGITSTLAATMA